MPCEHMPGARSPHVCARSLGGRSFYKPNERYDCTIDFAARVIPRPSPSLSQVGAPALHACRGHAQVPSRGRRCTPTNVHARLQPASLRGRGRVH